MRTRRFWLCAAPLLVLAAGLAVGAARRDGITFDEPAHLAAGYAVLHEGDYHLSPEHPPLARMWAALPLALLHPRWPPPQAPGWANGNFSRFSHDWLAQWNDGGERLVLAGRLMVVGLLVATCLAVARLAERLFGRKAALLALALAALDPAFLAHGHLVTTDLALTLAVTLSLLALSSLLAAPTASRLVVAAFALAAASLVKFSWVLLLPAAGVLVAMAVARRPAETGGAAAGRGRAARAAEAAGICLGLGAAVWLAIWGVYGFRFSPSRDAGNSTGVAALMPAVNGLPGQRPPATMAERWQTVLVDPSTGEGLGLLPPAIRFAREHRLLPEAYLYGLAYAWHSAQHRSAYLMGEYSSTGWISYFPIAFLLKTPLAILGLLAAGVLALLQRRASPAEPLLAAGLATFAVVYGGAALASRLDIGIRHLLPLEPFVCVVAGAAASWLETRARWLLFGALAWLLFASILAYPDHLSYFNEAAGGGRHGYLYLADSNVDWGQDANRLAAYSLRHPGEVLKVDLFGDGAVPLPRGFAPQPLLTRGPDGTLAPLTAGTYVISATELLGVYNPLVRDAAWERPELRERLHACAAAPPTATPASGPSCDLLLRCRLIARLRHRPPDARIGDSLFLFRLSAAEASALSTS